MFCCLSGKQIPALVILGRTKFGGTASLKLHFLFFSCGGWETSSQHGYLMRSDSRYACIFFYQDLLQFLSPYLT